MKYLVTFLINFAICIIILENFTEIELKQNLIIAIITSFVISYGVNKAKSNFNKQL